VAELEEKKKTSLGLEENLEGALTYALGFLTGILFFQCFEGASNCTDG